MTQTASVDNWREREWVLCAAKAQSPRAFAEAVRRELTLADLDDEIATGWLLFGILIVTVVGPILAYGYNLRPSMRLRRDAKSGSASLSGSDPECTILAKSSEMRGLLLQRAADDKQQVVRVMKLLRRSAALLVESERPKDQPEALRQLIASEADPFITACYERRLDGKPPEADTAKLSVVFNELFERRERLSSADRSELMQVGDSLERALPA